MKAVDINLIKATSAACLSLMFGLLWEGGASTAVFALIGFGAAVIVAACVLAEL